MGRGWFGAVFAVLACSPSTEVLEPAESSSATSGAGPMTGLPSESSSTTTTVGSESGEPPCPPPDGCLDVGELDPICEVAADCLLADSCCWCLAHPADEPPPDPCPADCQVTECEARGITEAYCGSILYSTTCLPARDCDPAHADCNEAPPDCPADMRPTVVDGCWSACIPIRSCFGVASCDDCPEGDVCLEYPQENLFTCVAPLPDCTDPTCMCLPEDACEYGNYFCEDGPERPACYPFLP